MTINIWWILGPILFIIVFKILAADTDRRKRDELTGNNDDDDSQEEKQESRGPTRSGRGKTFKARWK